MAFEWVRSLGGAEEEHETAEMADKNVTKGDILYGASGYVSNAFASVTVANVVGVAAESIDNSGGSAGDYDILVMTNPLNVYKVATSGTLAQSQVWTNVTLDAAGTIDEDDVGTDITGVIYIRKMVSTSAAEVSINFGTTADT